MRLHDATGGFHTHHHDHVFMALHCSRNGQEANPACFVGRPGERGKNPVVKLASELHVLEPGEKVRLLRIAEDPSGQHHEHVLASGPLTTTSLGRLHAQCLCQPWG